MLEFKRKQKAETVNSRNGRVESVRETKILEAKYFEQELIQRRFDFSGILYFGWLAQNI